VRDVAAVVSTCWSEQGTDCFPTVVGNVENGKILVTMTETPRGPLLSNTAFLLMLFYSFGLCRLFLTTKMVVMTLCIFQS